jgi:ubiquinone/menaquinone biosynthesis C-methylase UbiE
MFKYSFETLESVWNNFSDTWNKVITLSEVDEIKKFFNEEEELIVDFAKKYNSPLILELGCGSGRCLKVLQNNGFKKLFGIDISSKMLKKAKNSLSNSAILLQHDFRERLPFENNYFDIIIITGNTLTSGGVVESNIVLKQAFRILKKDGFLIIGSYDAEFMTEDLIKRYYGVFPKEFQIKRFDKKKKTVYFGILFSHWVTESEIKKLIEKAGFKLVSIQKKGIGLIAIAKKL